MRCGVIGRVLLGHELERPSAPLPTRDGAPARPRERGTDGGQVIVMVGVFTLGLLITAGFFIDMSLLFVSRRHAQHLADAAALSAAGAQVNEDPLRKANVLTFTPADLTARACAVVIAHPDIPNCSDASRVIITVDPGVSVTVEVHIDSPVTIMTLLGFAAQTVPGKATAGLIVDPITELPAR